MISNNQMGVQVVRSVTCRIGQLAVLAITIFPLLQNVETCCAQSRFSKSLLKKKGDWYRSAEARAIADSVVAYQSPQGGWPKSTNLAKPPASPDDVPSPGRGRANSFDNDATTVPMQFLARMTHATGDAKYKQSFLKGLDYTLDAQYPNGGWPQFWPLRKGYYSRVTFNDGAMVRVLQLVRDVADAEAPFDFVDVARRNRAARALDLGIECVLKSQIRQNGRLTAWCAQYDENTLEAAWARAYEPPSLSGGESVGIVRFLMEIEEPSPAIIASVQAAVAWFRDVQINGQRIETKKLENGRRDRTLVADPEAGPLWARFYELKTNRPLYLDRDSKFRYDFQEISVERRSGYAYHGNWPQSLLERDYPRWSEKHGVNRQHGATDDESLNEERLGDQESRRGALDGNRYRVVVSSDIGGTDPDDFQSMVHLCVYADLFDLEGIIASPFGDGRVKDILDVIDCYQHDYSTLKTYSDDYPTPDFLRSITKQGETERAPYAGARESTQGSEWIIQCALRDDPRPLHVLVWGGIEDVAQALHDAPQISDKLRVYWIGGPNKKWAPDAYQYIVDHHPNLWIIESNAAYRGWFTGGNQSGDMNNRQFVARHIKDHGKLGDLFVHHKADVKMGDTPSVGWLLKGDPRDPTKPGWGGRYVRAWKRPYLQLDRMPSAGDRMEIFGILELVLPVDRNLKNAEATLRVENQRLAGHVSDDGSKMHFRFCPKAAKHYKFTIDSNVPSLDNQAGTIEAHRPDAATTATPDKAIPNWWTDDPNPQYAEGPHDGAKTVNRWREEFLTDFANRMDRCRAAKASRN